LLSEQAEKELHAAIERAEAEVSEAIRSENYAAAMVALGRLRAPVDRFFDDVLVNVDDGQVRANRLALLDRIRSATQPVADFSKISG
jgi:glycyl-tRNA synthetase beta chain